MQQAPRPPRSPWVRYLPFIVIIVIIAVVAIAIGVSRSDNNKKQPVTVGSGGSPNAQSGVNGVPLFYNDAKAKGEADKHTWQDHCDKTTGYVAIPALNRPPCVEKWSGGDNGGVTSPGVTADTIKVGYYIAKPDPLFDQALKATGTYDPPEATAKVTEAYFHLYEKVFELYGRHLQLVRLNGTGTSTDAVAARADADAAAAKGVFAVIGGPAQAREFGDELSSKKILCLGGCIISQPQKYILEHEPYLYPLGPTPDETNTLVTLMIKNNLVGKPAQWAGGDLAGKPRTFAMLTYNTQNGQYTPSWDDLQQKLNDAGARIVPNGRVDYFLDFAKLQADARTIAAKLKSTGATDIVFSGDPIFPVNLTQEMTKQNYFPEWVMGGTVLADTVAFARNYDPQQWKHAFGINISHPLTVKTDQDAYKLHTWWYGTPPETDNNYGVVDAPIRMFMTGLQVAGPHLTPESFKAGIDAITPNPDPSTTSARAIFTWGNHGLWPGVADDPGGIDNVSMLWWDPNTSGQNETGKEGVGEYRILNNGQRYTASHFPTTPLPFFDSANTVTVYPAGQLPPDLTPPDVPVPADAPNPKK